MDKVKIRLFYFFLPAFVLLEKCSEGEGGLLKFYFSLFSKNEEKNVLRNVNVVVAAVVGKEKIICQQQDLINNCQQQSTTVCRIILLTSCIR